MIRTVFVSASVIALAIGTANAADYPIGPIITPQYVVSPAYVITPGFSWNGFYVGGNVGGHFGSDKITPTADAAGGFGPAGAAAINAMSPTTLNPEGVIGGIQGGYNWQIGNVLYGLEVDASAVGGTAQRTLSGFPCNRPRRLHDKFHRGHRPGDGPPPPRLGLGPQSVLHNRRLCVW